MAYLSWSFLKMGEKSDRRTSLLFLLMAGIPIIFTAFFVFMLVQFLRSLPLRAVNHEEQGTLDRWFTKVMPAGETVPEREKLHIPLFKLPAQSQLQMHYYYDVVKQGACKDVPLDNVRGSVEADSTIDISGFPHFIAMPDLAALGNAGFPFTRMAD